MTGYKKLQIQAENCQENNDTEGMFFFFNKLVELAIEGEDTIEVAHGLYNLGCACRRAGLYKESLQVLKKTINIIKNMKGRILSDYYYLYISFSCVEIALTYEKLGHYDLSLRYYEAAIPLMKEYERIDNCPGGCSSIYQLFSCISDLYSYMEDYQKSEKYKQMAIDECEYQLYILMNFEEIVEGEKLYKRLKYLINNTEDSYRYICLADGLLKPIDGRENDISIEEAKLGKTIYMEKAYYELKSNSYAIAIISAQKLLVYTKIQEKKVPGIAFKDELAYSYYILAEGYLGNKLYKDAIETYQKAKSIYDEIMQDDSSNTDTSEMYLICKKRIVFTKQLLEGATT